MDTATQTELTRPAIVDRFRQRIKDQQRTRLTREERETLASILVDTLVQWNQQGIDTREQIEELCNAEKALLEEGFTLNSVNSEYLPTYTRMVKAAIAEGKIQLNDRNSYPKAWTKRDGSESSVTQTHYALTSLVYDTQTQTQLRAATTARNNERQDDLKPVRLYPYVEAVQKLLESRAAVDLTIALAAVLGRRFIEIVKKGHFGSTEAEHIIEFEGQAKKKEPEGYKTLSLFPAKVVLPILETYRALPEVERLADLAEDHPDVQAFHSRVNRRVKELFQDTELVPILAKHKSVTIHRLRGLYGTIAIHFFCPNNQNVHRFLQRYLGHVLDTQSGAPNSRATDHYFHYYLVRNDGLPINARGVRLSSDPTLMQIDPSASEIGTAPPLPAAESTEEKPEMTTPRKTEKTEKPGSLRIEKHTQERWVEILTRYSKPTQQERMTALLKELEAGERTPARDKDEAAQATVVAQATTLQFLTQEIERYRAELHDLKLREATATQKLTQVEQLESELVALRQENQRLRKIAEDFEKARRFFGGSVEQTEETQPTASAAATASVASNSTNPTSAPTAQPKQKTQATAQSGGAYQRAKDIFEKLQEWNQQHADRTFALTPGLLERDFGIHRKAANGFMEQHKAAIDEYHASNGVVNPSSHNRQSGRNANEFKQFVKGEGEGET